MWQLTSRISGAADGWQETGRRRRPIDALVMARIGDEMDAYGKHFVMMYSQDGKAAMPIVDEEGDVCLYVTASDARKAMKDHPYAQAFGYEIFCMGNGED